MSKSLNSKRCGVSASRSLGPISGSASIIENTWSMASRSSFADSNEAATIRSSRSRRPASRRAWRRGRRRAAGVAAAGVAAARLGAAGGVAPASRRRLRGAPAGFFAAADRLAAGFFAAAAACAARPDASPRCAWRAALALRGRLALRRVASRPACAWPCSRAWPPASWSRRGARRRSRLLRRGRFGRTSSCATREASASTSARSFLTSSRTRMSSSVLRTRPAAAAISSTISRVRSRVDCAPSADADSVRSTAARTAAMASASPALLSFFFFLSFLAMARECYAFFLAARLRAGLGGAVVDREPLLLARDRRRARVERLVDELAQLALDGGEPIGERRARVPRRRPRKLLAQPVDAVLEPVERLLDALQPRADRAQPARQPVDVGRRRQVERAHRRLLRVDGLLARGERSRDRAVDQRVLEQVGSELAERLLALARQPIAQALASSSAIVATPYRT